MKHSHFSVHAYHWLGPSAQPQPAEWPAMSAVPVRIAPATNPADLVVDLMGHGLTHPTPTTQNAQNKIYNGCIKLRFVVLL